VGAPYEPPVDPDLVLCSDETVEQEVERVMELLAARGLIRPDA
jgi:adenylylsulfate kinase-like enzyme